MKEVSFSSCLVGFKKFVGTIALLLIRTVHCTYLSFFLIAMHAMVAR